MSDPDTPIDLAPLDETQQELTQLWIVSYSDFMTILMIFFLMLFAHRVWSKTTNWEIEHTARLRAAQEAQRGMVQRLTRLASIDVQAQRIDIHLPDALLFESGHADLKGSADALLAQISPDLASFKGQIVVEGHTDNQALGRGSRYRSNWELSVARAFSVIKSLAAHGINPARLAARGFGPYRPRSPNDSAAHRAENRRIEILLLKVDKDS